MSNTQERLEELVVERDSPGRSIWWRRSIGTLCRSEVYWRWVGNWKPWLLHRLFPPALDRVQRQVLDQLRCRGIAMTTVDQLGVQGAFRELEDWVRCYDSAMAGELAQRRDRAEDPGFKTYLVQMLGPWPTLRPPSISVRFSVQPAILGVVNSYFGMFTRLRGFNFWRNIATTAPPRNSQLWHRDPEDRRIIKLFVYLSDVDAGAGPLTYVPGTHSRGALRVQPESYLEEPGDPLRSTDAQMSAVVPPDRWLTATGPRGTVVLVDTRGYHKGGQARDRDRILYTATFTSQRSYWPDQFRRTDPLPRCRDRSVAFALGAR
jgi:hypothetical protein